MFVGIHHGRIRRDPAISMVTRGPESTSDDLRHAIRQGVRGVLGQELLTQCLRRQCLRRLRFTQGLQCLDAKCDRFRCELRPWMALVVLF
jgi:hypothetical protein